MNEKGVGALAVMQKDALIGMISERDYAGKVILQGRSSKDTMVKEIMTTHVFHTVPEQTIDECLVIMNERRIRHLPVIHDDKLIGMLSIGDVVRIERHQGDYFLVVNNPLRTQWDTLATKLRWAEKPKYKIDK